MRELSTYFTADKGESILPPSNQDVIEADDDRSRAKTLIESFDQDNEDR